MYQQGIDISDVTLALVSLYIKKKVRQNFGRCDAVIFNRWISSDGLD